MYLFQYCNTAFHMKDIISLLLVVIIQKLYEFLASFIFFY